MFWLQFGDVVIDMCASTVDLTIRVCYGVLISVTDSAGDIEDGLSEK